MKLESSGLNFEAGVDHAVPAYFSRSKMDSGSFEVVSKIFQ
ncbi:hypothetical protein [Formosa sp. PL04]|nr:hypothetical protein [Formosa sp. PL04]MDW5287203.1 hypothetical protein [Formosa sp. PL04]